MKKGFLVEKSMFMITILITSIFSVSLISPEVSALDVCCEKALSGEYCRYEPQQNCDLSVRSDNVPVPCSETSYCQLGCCFDPDQGVCSSNVPLAACDFEGSEWHPFPDCDISICQKGCCVVQGECSYLTYTACSNIFSSIEGLETDFREVDNEDICLEICASEDQGCCISERLCVYSSRSSCNGDFHSAYCADIPECDCTSHDHKACVDEDVFWFDSCNNIEDLAEDCSFVLGNFCGIVDGEAVCKSLDCSSTFDSEHVDYDGVSRKNGESWCQYDGITGAGFDLVGSRHYRHMCINGEEIVEPCKDFREEICVQVTITDSSLGSYSESSCVSNRWSDCTEFENKDDCENPQNGNCFWAGICLPLVPPGLKFWSDDSAGSVARADAEETCNQASVSCTVVWTRDSWRDPWDCKHNCECLANDFVNGMNAFCRSLGDCGAHYNYVGEFTSDGFSESSPAVLEIPPFEQMSNAGIGLNIGQFSAEDVGFFGLFESPIPLIGVGIGVLAVWVSGYYLLFGTSAIASGMTATILGTTVAEAGGEQLAAALNAKFAAEGGLVGKLFGISSAAKIAPILGYVGVAVAALAVLYFVFFQLGADQKEETYTFSCLPWQAPSGGDDCELCQEIWKDCSEYRCKSLGQSCSFIPENAGTNRVACYNAFPNDVNSPIIEPWPEALTPGFDYELFTNGFSISPNVSAYKEISFGVKTNELSQCKYSSQHTSSYDEMESFFGDSFYSLFHNMTLRLQPGTSKEFYIRCQDPAGNSNLAEYLITLASDAGPDLTPPIVVSINPESGTGFRHGIGESLFNVYLNEPSSCRWSSQDLSYDDMQNSFNCYLSPDENYLYHCQTSLQVLDDAETTYYFRCQDQNNNQHQMSRTITLIGTSPLQITSTSPSGQLLTTNSPALQVNTNRVAECAFSTHDVSLSSMIKFMNTDSTTHSQQLTNLALNDYLFYIKCRDDVNNQASAQIQFSIAVDSSPPILIYIFSDSSFVHVILNEPSSCEYSSSTFAFGSGNLMSGSGTEHTAPISESPMNIICKDQFDNFMSSFVVYP